MTVRVVKEGRVKKVFIESVLRLNKKNRSIDYGLCDSIGRAIHDYSDVAEINIIWLRNTEQAWEKYITKDMGNFNVSSGGDLTDAWVDVVVYDYSSDEYTADNLELLFTKDNVEYVAFKSSKSFTKVADKRLPLRWEIYLNYDVDVCTYEETMIGCL